MRVVDGVPQVCTRISVDALPALLLCSSEGMPTYLAIMVEMYLTFFMSVFRWRTGGPLERL